MKVGIMQPYLFPYLGYFQLINAVDKFVVYDDVQYMKGGWINRNRILINGSVNTFTLRIKKDDFRLNINQRYLVENYQYENKKILKSIELAYKKATYYDNVIGLIKDILMYDETNLSKFITNSIIQICKYLELDTEIILSSTIEKEHMDDAQDKVIQVNKLLDADTYINAIGGKELYSKSIFKANGLNLYFIKMNNVTYKQFNNEFIPCLSIIDVLMFNSKKSIKELLNQYTLD
ncbi:MAG: WbqC family protein [Bacillota bacterium]|nr:WbqC family protein [Bacillota bacterium]